LSEAVWAPGHLGAGRLGARRLGAKLSKHRHSASVSGINGNNHNMKLEAGLMLKRYASLSEIQAHAKNVCCIDENNTSLTEIKAGLILKIPATYLLP